jgi:uncharacterized protein
MDLILQPWPWYVSGALIAFVMWLLLYFGKSFGFSNNLRTLCTMCGADKFAPFFQFNWKTNFLTTPDYVVAISEATKDDLGALGFAVPTAYAPASQFGMEALSSWQNILILALGGFMVGFGARYAGGCTSGHAISGISDLQPASLLAVVGFFIGGLAMTHLIFPLIY